MPTDPTADQATAKLRKRAALVWDLIRHSAAYQADYAQFEKWRCTTDPTGTPKLEAIHAMDAIARRWVHLLPLAMIEMPDPTYSAADLPPFVLDRIVASLSTPIVTPVPGWSPTEDPRFALQVSTPMFPWSEHEDVILGAREARRKFFDQEAAFFSEWLAAHKAALLPVGTQTRVPRERALAVHYRHTHQGENLASIAASIGKSESTASRDNRRGRAYCPTCRASVK